MKKIAKISNSHWGDISPLFLRAIHEALLGIITGLFVGSLFHPNIYH
jgi:hypothetical protein